MKEVVEELTNQQFDFIEKEFGLTKENLLSMTENEIGELYDKVCDIELTELGENAENVSERCSIAADIVTLLGNTIDDEEDE